MYDTHLLLFHAPFPLQHNELYIDVAQFLIISWKQAELHRKYFLWFFKSSSFFFFLLLFFIYLFIFFKFVVNFVIHWNETSLSLHVFPIPIPPPTTLSTRSLPVHPEHQVRALVSCIQPGLVICFTLDSIHFWAYTPGKPDLKETHAPQCSSQHCLS